MKQFLELNRYGKKYFSVNEVIKHFKKKKYLLNFEDICGYVRKRIIHPVVYIDSVPTHAHETINVKQALAIGFCNIIWHQCQSYSG